MNILVAAFSVVIVIIGSCSADQAPWQNYGSDILQTFRANTEGPKETLTEIWNFSFTWQSAIDPSPPFVVVGPPQEDNEGIIFVGYGATVSAIKKGKVIWSWNSTFYEDLEGDIAALSLNADGSQIFARMETENGLAATSLFGWDSQTGENVWKGFPCKEWIYCDSVGMSISDDNIMYVAGNGRFQVVDAYVSAYSIQQQSLLWTIDTDSKQLSSMPVIDESNQVMYIDQCAINLPSGNSKWCSYVGWSPNNLLMNGKEALYGFYFPIVWAINSTNGSQIWEYNFISPENGVFSNYCIDKEGNLYLVVSGYQNTSKMLGILSFNQFGIRWQLNFQSQYMDNKIAVDSASNLYFILNNSEGIWLLCIEGSSSVILWKKLILKESENKCQSTLWCTTDMILGEEWIYLILTDLSLPTKESTLIAFQ